MKSVTINLYSFDELDEKAKRKAIEDHREFELSIMQEGDFISGDPKFDTDEELKKAYDLQWNYYMMNDEPIIESIEANDYLFFNNGELAHTLEYTGKHEKAGTTEFILYGETFTL